MVYIKIKDNNNTIISVESLANPNFVCWQERNGITVSCSQVRAQGVVSQTGDCIYQLDGKEPLPTSRTKEGVRAVIIAEADYDELVLQLGNPEIVSPQEPSYDETNLNEVKANKIKSMNVACQNIIFQGIDVLLSDEGVHHFSLTEYDQLNLFKLETIARSGEVEVLPYHEDDELCKFYPAADIIAIADAATNYITYHTTYFNSLKQYIKSMTSIEDVTEIMYGVEIPEDYQSDVWKELNK